MYNNTNPAELYSKTTWELITSDKYIRTGSTALQTGGSNSVNITKANLPNIKIPIDTFSGSIKTSALTKIETNWDFINSVNIPANGKSAAINQGGTGGGSVVNSYYTNTETSKSFSASPYTQALGSGNALSVDTRYITLKFWKRLT